MMLETTDYKDYIPNYFSSEKTKESQLFSNVLEKYSDMAGFSDSSEEISQFTEWVNFLISFGFRWPSKKTMSRRIALVSMPSSLSNISSDIIPQLSVSANVKEAFVPSDDVTVNAEPDAETPRLVETLVLLAVLAAIAVFIELASLSAVTASSAILGVVTALVPITSTVI